MSAEVTLFFFSFPLCPPCSFKKTWGCGAEKTEKDIAAYNVICEQHRLLGPMSFGEISVLGLFSLLVVLWFTRDPGFVPGWATDIFNSKAKEFVSRLCLVVILQPYIELPGKTCIYPCSLSLHLSGM